MKKIFIISLFIGLVSCNASDSESTQTTESESKTETEMNINESINISASDLTGTWIMKTEERGIRIETDEYLSSSFRESRIVLDDTDQGVKIDECSRYAGVYSQFGVKTDTYFYMRPYDLSDTGFLLQDDGSLVQKSEYEHDYNPGIKYDVIKTLTKISDNFEIDNGTMIINGPITLSEYDHVCVTKVYSNLGDTKQFGLSAPLGDGTLDFSITLRGEVEPGSYYIEDDYSNVAALNIYSSADIFWETVNSNTLGVTEVTLNIVENTDAVLKGNFSLTGHDDQMYTGEFEFDLVD